MAWQWSALLFMVTATFFMVAYYARDIHRDLAKLNGMSEQAAFGLPLRTIKSNYVSGKNFINSIRFIFCLNFFIVLFLREEV
jgi:hypothetical protein